MTQQSNLTHKSSLTPLQCPKSRAKNLKLWSQFCICSVNHSKSSHVYPLLLQPIFTPWLASGGRPSSIWEMPQLQVFYWVCWPPLWPVPCQPWGRGRAVRCCDDWRVIPGIDSCNRVMQTLRMIVSIGLVASLGILVASQQGYEVWDHWDPQNPGAKGWTCSHSGGDD